MREREKARRLPDGNPGVSFALVRFDIGRFQTCSSFWGEEEGDRLLRSIARRRPSCSRSSFPAPTRPDGKRASQSSRWQARKK